MSEVIDAFPELDPNYDTTGDEQAQLAKEVARAHHARQILDNPLWQDLITANKQAVFDEWAASEDNAIERREWLRHRFQIIDGLHISIQEFAETGKLAAARQEQIQEGKRASLEGASA